MSGNDVTFQIIRGNGIRIHIANVCPKNKRWWRVLRGHLGLKQTSEPVSMLKGHCHGENRLSGNDVTFQIIRGNGIRIHVANVCLKNKRWWRVLRGHLGLKQTSNLCPCYRAIVMVKTACPLMPSHSR